MFVGLGLVWCYSLVFVTVLLEFMGSDCAVNVSIAKSFEHWLANFSHHLLSSLISGCKCIFASHYGREKGIPRLFFMFRLV